MVVGFFRNPSIIVSAAFKYGWGIFDTRLRDHLGNKLKAMEFRPLTLTLKIEEENRHR